MRLLAAVALFLAVAVSAMPAVASVEKSVSTTSETNCSRECITDIVSQILESMVAHDPNTLPLAQVYEATENSHAAALGMMTSWRTVTKADPIPDLLAVDTTNGSAYFALAISEGNDQKQSVLWGRVKVVNKQITELELYINRSRGDHGFSFSAAELPENYKRWMSPPANRTKATRAQLEAIGAAIFDPSDNITVSVASDCQFTEEGWSVVDTGNYGNESSTPLGCTWLSARPSDTNARANLVVDEEFGIVVTAGMVPGKVYPYANISESAFIPDSQTSAQEAQEEWFAAEKAEGVAGLLNPTAATGETINVIQFYNDELQGYQINVHLGGPNMTSAWTL